MHAAVHEDAARRFGEAHEEAGFVVLVAGLRPHQEGMAQIAFVDGGFGLGVTGVEAAHETDHGHQFRVFFRHRFHGFAGGHVQRQRLFNEHMFAGPQAGGGLVGVQRGRRDQHHGMHIGIGQHGLQAVMATEDAQLVACPFEFRCDRTAGCDQLGAGRVPGELLGVALAQSAQAGDADVQCGLAHVGPWQGWVNVSDLQKRPLRWACQCRVTGDITKPRPVRCGRSRRPHRPAFAPVRRRAPWS